MAPIIWGFDLAEMSWSSFRTSAMMDKRYHLRPQRIVSYKVAMLICLAAECTATYSLTKYENIQINMERTYTRANGYPIFPGYDKVHLYQNDLIDAEIVTIVFCVLVACIFGADFFFLVMFPRQTYPRWYNLVKRAFAAVICVGLLIASIVSTVVVATHSAKFDRAPRSVYDEAVAHYYRPPMQYNKWPTNIAYVVLLWLGTIATFVATMYMFKAISHDEKHGTKPLNEKSRGSLSDTQLNAPEVVA